MIEHTEKDIAALFTELSQLGDPARIPVAIERGEGLVVGRIARAGHPVLMIEPTSFKAARPRWGSAGAKSDAADAFMLADYARTTITAAPGRTRSAGHWRSLPRTFAQEPRWSRHARRSRTSCGRSCPSTGPARRRCLKNLTSQVALKFLVCPTPQSAALLGEGLMRQFCHRHSYRGGKSAAELHQAAPSSARRRQPHRTEGPRNDRSWIHPDRRAQHRNHPSRG